jgi:hypothetical protein
MTKPIVASDRASARSPHATPSDIFRCADRRDHIFLD